MFRRRLLPPGKQLCTRLVSQAIKQPTRRVPEAGKFDICPGFDHATDKSHTIWTGPRQRCADHPAAHPSPPRCPSAGPTSAVWDNIEHNHRNLPPVLQFRRARDGIFVRCRASRGGSSWFARPVRGLTQRSVESSQVMTRIYQVADGCVTTVGMLDSRRVALVRTDPDPE